MPKETCPICGARQFERVGLTSYGTMYDDGFQDTSFTIRYACGHKAWWSNYRDGLVLNQVYPNNHTWLSKIVAIESGVEALLTC